MKFAVVLVAVIFMLGACDLDFVCCSMNGRLHKEYWTTIDKWLKDEISLKNCTDEETMLCDALLWMGSDPIKICVGPLHDFQKTDFKMTTFGESDSKILSMSRYRRAMLKIAPEVRALAEGLTNAMVDVYMASQDHFTQDDQPHFVYSPRELTSARIHETSEYDSYE